MALIENPVLNSPFREPSRHFKFAEDGITNEILSGRRPSSHFVPILRAKKKGKQLQFETEWTKDRIEPNAVVDRIRRRVGAWRQGGYVGVTGTTSRLLAYWSHAERDKPLFFCQLEAVETAIYITEVARKYGDAWIENDLRSANDTSNPGLPRVALKMATGSGKTVVMAMLIAWQALNKLEDRHDARFSDAFLVVTPGITIRDRLRVLLPTDPDNYYRQLDVLPSDLLERLAQARILITNYHAFMARERGDAARLTKAILTRGATSAFLETPDQVVRRVCRDLAGKKNIDGVPFSFIPCSGSNANANPGPIPTRVRALEDRITCEITFPRLLGYRHDVLSEKLSATFTADSKLALSTADIPTRTENAPIVGERSIHTLDDLKRHCDNEVAFLLAKLTLEKYFRQDNEQKTDRPSVHRFDADVKGWLFPQMLVIAKRWLAECVTCKDNTFPQLLLLVEFAHDAADRIYKAIVESAAGTPALKPILRPYDVLGSTRYVDFDTTKAVYPTDPAKCHISHVVADTGSWEQRMAQALEEMPEVGRYVTNQSLGFTIPYALNGEEKQYYPDFIAGIGDLNLIVEVTGEARKDKAAKVTTAGTLWVPAVNNHGGFGQWAFVEVADPWDAESTVRAAVQAVGVAAS